MSTSGSTVSNVERGTKGDFELMTMIIGKITDLLSVTFDMQKIFKS